MATEGCWQHYW